MNRLSDVFWEMPGGLGPDFILFCVVDTDSAHAGMKYGKTGRFGGKLGIWEGRCRNGKVAVSSDMLNEKGESWG